jgi:hypothetical protein
MPIPCHTLLLLMPLLAGCLQSAPPRPADAPPPPPPQAAPVLNPEEAEPPRIVLAPEVLATMRQPAAAKPVWQPPPAPRVQATVPAAQPAQPPGIEEMQPAAPQPGLAPSRPRAAPLPEQSPVASKALAWLQFCATVYDAGNAIRCDTNSLLAQPSAKVQVYVREPALVRTTPGGPIRLREGLPNLYRIFVLR